MRGGYLGTVIDPRKHCTHPACDRPATVQCLGEGPRRDHSGDDVAEFGASCSDACTSRSITHRSYAVVSIASDSLFQSSR